MTKQLAEEQEICREPAGTEAGGQFASCATAPASGQTATREPTPAEVKRGYDIYGHAIPAPANKVADNPRSMQPPPAAAPTVDQLLTQIVGPDPAAPVHGTGSGTAGIWRPDRALSNPISDHVATHWGGRGNANEVMNGGVNFYIEPESVTVFKTTGALGGESLRFTEGPATFDIKAEQLRKLLAVGENGYVRIVEPAPAENRSGWDLYVVGSWGTSFKERYHLNIDPSGQILGGGAHARLALVEREAKPEFMKSVAIEDRDKAQMEDIRYWVQHTPGVAFSARTPDGSTFTTNFTTLRTVPLTPAVPTAVQTPEAPKAQTRSEWEKGTVEPKSIEAGPGLLNSEDVDIVTYGDRLNDAEWLPYAAALAGAPPMSDVQVSGTPTNATLSVVGDHADQGDHVLSLTEHDGEKHLHINYMFLHEKGTGLGKQILASIVNAARQQGINEISLFAGGHGPKGASSMNGYYTWPRLGFNAAIPEDLQSKLLDDGFEASDLNELFDTNGGKEWWQENGEADTMSFDTSDGSASMRILGRYLKEAWGQNPFGKVNEDFEVEGELVLLDEADLVLQEVEAEICREPAGKPEGGQFASCGGVQGSGALGAVQTAPEPPTGSTEPRRGFQADIPSAGGGIVATSLPSVHLTITPDHDARIIGNQVQFSAFGGVLPIPSDTLRLITGAVPGSDIKIARGEREGEWSVLVAGDLAGHYFSERSTLSVTREGAVNFVVNSRYNDAALARAVWELPEFRDRVGTQMGSAAIAGYGFTQRRDPTPPPAPERDYTFNVADPLALRDPVYFQMGHGGTVYGRDDKLVFALSPALGGGVAEIPKTEIQAVMGAPPNAIVTIARGDRDGTWNTSVRGTLANVSFTELGKIAIDSDGRFTYSIGEMRTTGSLPHEFTKREVEQASAAANASVSFDFNPREVPPVGYGTPGGPSAPETHTPEEHTPPVSHADPIDLDDPMFFTGRNVRVRNTIDTDENEEPDWVGEAAAMVGAPPHARVHVYNNYSDEYKVESDFEGGSAEITVNPDENSVYFDSLFLDQSAQGEGLGTRIMASALMAAHSNGFSDFTLSAAGGYGGSMNGYYTWPRLGFDGHLNSSHAERARADLGVGKDEIGNKISDLFKVEGGADWWKRNGYGFHASFDLDLNGPSFKTLGKYLKHRFGTNPFIPERAGHSQFPGSGFESFEAEWIVEVEAVIAGTNLCRQPAGTDAGGEFMACDVSAEVEKIVAQNLLQFPIPDIDPALAGVFNEPTMATITGDIEKNNAFATQIIRDTERMRQFTTGYVEIKSEGSSVQIGTPLPAGEPAEGDLPEGKISFPTDADAPSHFQPLVMDQELLRRLVGARADGSIRLMDEARGYKILVSGPPIDGVGSAEGMYHLRTDSTGQWHLWRGAGETGIFKDGHYDTSAVIGRQDVQKDAREELIALGGSTERLFASNVKFTVEDGIEFNPDTGEIKLSFTGSKSEYNNEVGGVVATPGAAKFEKTFDIEELARLVSENKHLEIQQNSKGGYDLTVSGAKPDWSLGYSEHDSPSYGLTQTLTLTSGIADETVESDDDLPSYDSDALTLPKGVKMEVELPTVEEPEEEEEDEESSDSDLLSNVDSRESEFRRSIRDAEAGRLPTEDTAEYVKGMKELLSHRDETIDAVGNMDEREVAALSSYLGSGSKAIGNAQQGKGGCSGSTCHAFDNALDQLPKFSGNTWHGRNYTKERAAEFLAGIDVGDVLVWGRSYSSSVSRESGDNFTHTLMFRIENGRSGRTIGLISQHSDEFEVLFPKGVRMEVLKIEPDRTPGQTLVTVREFIEDRPRVMFEAGEQIVGNLCRQPAGSDAGGEFTSCDGDAIVTQSKLPYGDVAMRVTRGGFLGNQGQFSWLAPREFDPAMLAHFTSGDVAIKGETPMFVPGSPVATVTSDSVYLSGNRGLGSANDPPAGITIPRDQFIRMVGAPDHSHIEIKGVGPSSYTIDVTGSVGSAPIQDQLKMFYRSESEARELNATTGVRVGNIPPYSSGWILASEKFSVARTDPTDALIPDDTRELVMHGAWDQWRAQGGAVEKLEKPEDEPEEDEHQGEDDEDDDSRERRDSEREPPARHDISPDILGTEPIFNGSEVVVRGNITGYSDEDVARLAGAPPGSTVTVEKSDYEDSITLMVKGDHTNDQMVRLFPETGRMSWSRYFPNEAYQRGDLGTKIFATIVDAAKELGYERIAIHAIGDHKSATEPNPRHRASGYLAWVKLGGNASLANVDFSRQEYAEEARRKGWETIADIVNTKGGMSWWYKHGGEWSGDFDTRAGSYSMKRLGSKMKQKFGKNPFGPKNEFAEGEFFDEAYNADYET